MKRANKTYEVCEWKKGEGKDVRSKNKIQERKANQQLDKKIVTWKWKMRCTGQNIWKMLNQFHDKNVGSEG